MEVRRLRAAYLAIILGYAILTVFFGVWKIIGMPPGYRGDYLDLFDDVVALTGLGSGLILLWFIRREKLQIASRRE